jgi:hypothetical protein
MSRGFALCDRDVTMKKQGSEKAGLGKKRDSEKKPGSQEPGLRYWPREADTITFQEGLLSTRATGGGGHMRDANAQRVSTMIPNGTMRQPGEPHVRHAESGEAYKHR